jgi:hypothetical protein
MLIAAGAPMEIVLPLVLIDTPPVALRLDVAGALIDRVPPLASVD